MNSQAQVAILANWLCNVLACNDNNEDSLYEYAVKKAISAIEECLVALGFNDPNIASKHKVVLSTYFRLNMVMHDLQAISSGKHIDNDKFLEDLRNLLQMMNNKNWIPKRGSKYIVCIKGKYLGFKNLKACLVDDKSDAFVYASVSEIAVAKDVAMTELCIDLADFMVTTVHAECGEFGESYNGESIEQIQHEYFEGLG